MPSFDDWRRCWRTSTPPFACWTVAVQLEPYGEEVRVQMGDKSAIEWTDATWNPVTGCTKVSPGCKHCYAERLAARLQAMGNPRYRNGFQVTLHPDQLELPLRWAQPRRIFVNSMSDLFHEAVPEAFIRQVFAVMERASWHVFQVLTKRDGRLAEMAPRLPWPPNVWQGVSVESAQYVSRVANLQTVPARVRFLSVEPMLGRVSSLPLDRIHWVIVGGESGPRHRPIELMWVREVRDQCLAAEVPFFFKQWGGVTPKSGGRLLDGRQHDAFPVADAAPVPEGARRARLIDEVKQIVRCWTGPVLTPAALQAW